tara:strand:+ start:1116 stop:1601 length:486 start_codon:yes stop_codon:yes gene_type:complete
MNRILLLVILCAISNQAKGQEAEIRTVLDAWHQAASDADFDVYFGLMTKDAVFIGTDATENWDRSAFRSYAKPHFDQGKAWHFTALQRHVYLNGTNDIAWFDELLDTQMKLCRGSGVVKKVAGQWKIAHYVLSIAVPNEIVDQLVDLKREKDSLLMAQLKN